MIFSEQASSIPSTTGTQPAHLTAGLALESARRRSPAAAAARAATSPTRECAELARVIVVAVDSSGSAARVLAMAAGLARACPGAELHVVHVFPRACFERARAGVPGAGTEALASAQEHLEAQVRSARELCDNPVTGHFLVGDPAQQILRVRAQSHADLLVIGTRDHSGLERLLLGSITDALTRNAGCPVLVARPTKAR
jgi:nucleotide-binding universal stress UspA family protein